MFLVPTRSFKLNLSADGLKNKHTKRLHEKQSEKPSINLERRQAVSNVTGKRQSRKKFSTTPGLSLN